jgi:hemerythrin superfamily protein
MPRTTNSKNDAVTLLEKDHAAVEKLFRRFERTRAPAERKRLSERIVRELSIHAAIEEQLVYPQLRRRLDGREALVLVALEEHHLAKVALAEIEKVPAADERLAPKMHVLIESVRRHVREEERVLFAEMRRKLSADELGELGELLLRARDVAPTRPHPEAPDAPPANLLTNPGAAAYDRGREVVSRSLERSREAVARTVGESRGSLERRLDRVVARGRRLVGLVLRVGEDAAHRARQRVGRGIERAGREVRAT